MKLTAFIHELFTSGHLTVQLEDSSNVDAAKESEALIAVIQKYYEADSTEMPGRAPAFSAPAAIWAAQYFYKAVFYAVNRNATAVEVDEGLNLFAEPITPPAIYSADLVLRHLPALTTLVKGLAPADILVKKLEEAAVQWPYSSVGMELTQAIDETILLQHPGLRISYVDRVIEKKDTTRITPAIKILIQEATGRHINLFWPELLTDHTYNTI